jgi:hypothetical protein
MYSTTEIPKIFPTVAALLGKYIVAQGEYSDGDPPQ